MPIRQLRMGIFFVKNDSALDQTRVHGHSNPLTGIRHLSAHSLLSFRATECDQQRAEPISRSGAILRLNPLEDSDWDARLYGIPGATCFHSAAWMRVLHETYGYSPCCFASFDSEGFVGLLPMMEVSSILTGRRGVSLPFTDFCQAIGVSGFDFQPLVKHALQYAGERSWGHAEFRGNAGIPTSAPIAGRHLAHRLDLGKGADALWSATNSAARRSIRKARDSGVVISSGHDEAAMRMFFRLHCLTRKRHGVPPQPYTFFSNIRRYLLEQGLANILLASDKDGKTVAAAVFLHFGKHAIYKFGASDIASQDLRANHLLMWEAIRRHASEGMRELHMGRTETAHAGLRRYKLAWGSREQELVYYRYAPAKSGFVAGTGPNSQWTRKIFSRTPVLVSRLIGALAYRHMA
jgi:hypothetical protein